MLKLGLIQQGISNFMLCEQMFRVGGLGLRYVLQYLAPEGFCSVFSQPEFVARLEACGGLVDYDYVLGHAVISEAKGAFLALRWQDPTHARELLQKYWDQRIKEVEDKLAFLSHMQSNLSLADEPFLSDILQSSSSKKVRSQAKKLLQRIVGSHYAKQCVQHFFAHVHYLGPDELQSGPNGDTKADKGGLKVELFA